MAALGAAISVPAPLTSAFGVASAGSLPVPDGIQTLTMTDPRPAASSLGANSEPALDRPAQAVPAPAPEDIEHRHFGELGFTGVTPESPSVPAQTQQAEPESEAAEPSEPSDDAQISAAQTREEDSSASRSEVRQEAPAEPVAPAAPSTGGQGAEAAIAWAQANLGLPYGWGSSSGGAYDCSGFTTAAFRAAGISIPHQSEAQFHATSRVALSEIRRGDLLFYSSNGAASGIFHVAIYLGDGQVIHSLRDWSSWDGSKVSDINYASGLMAAGRP